MSSARPRPRPGRPLSLSVTVLRGIIARRAGPAGAGGRCQRMSPDRHSGCLEVASQQAASNDASNGLSESQLEIAFLNRIVMSLSRKTREIHNRASREKRRRKKKDGEISVIFYV